MGRKTTNNSALEAGATVTAFSKTNKERRARIEMRFEDQSLLIPLFGEYDANWYRLKTASGSSFLLEATISKLRVLMKQLHALVILFRLCMTD